jgi:hypothetical protein
MSQGDVELVSPRAARAVKNEHGHDDLLISVCRRLALPQGAEDMLPRFLGAAAAPFFR